MILFLRYLGISILKWAAVFAAISVFTAFVDFPWLKGYLLALPIWVIVFIVAYFFAMWALHRSYPDRRKIALLIGTWMVVTLSIQIAYEIVALGRPVFVFYSLDLYVQYLLEILAIIVAARMLRMKKMRSAAAEGIAVN